MQRLRVVACALLALLIGALLGAHPTQAMEPAQAARIARRYRASDDEDQRKRLAARLEEYDGPIEPVIKRLASRRYDAVETGYLP
jgi:hypothetical protein